MIINVWNLFSLIYIRLLQELHARNKAVYRRLLWRLWRRMTSSSLVYGNSILVFTKILQLIGFSKPHFFNFQSFFHFRFISCTSVFSPHMFIFWCFIRLLWFHTIYRLRSCVNIIVQIICLRDPRDLYFFLFHFFNKEEDVLTHRNLFSSSFFLSNV